MISVAIYEAVMKTRLREFRDDGVIAYLDDILIDSKTMGEQETLVRQVLARLECHDLAVSLKQVVFHVDSIEFLAYMVGRHTTTMSEEKVVSILNWKAP